MSNDYQIDKTFRHRWGLGGSECGLFAIDSEEVVGMVTVAVS